MTLISSLNKDILRSPPINSIGLSAPPLFFYPQVALPQISNIYNLFYALTSIPSDIKEICVADSLNDQEGKIRAGVSLSTRPLILINTAGSIILSIDKIIHYISSTIHTHLSYVTLCRCAIIPGICASLLQLFLESSNLYQIHKLRSSLIFLTHPKKELSSAQKEGLLLNNLQTIKNKCIVLAPEELTLVDAKIKKVFSHLNPVEQEIKKKEEIDKILNKKMTQLKRRVQPWLAEGIKTHISQVISKLNSSDPSTKEEGKMHAQEILEHIDIQSKKTIINSILIIIAATLFLIGMTASLFFCPYLVPLIFLILGSSVTFGQYIYESGYLNSQNWNFNASSCAPAWMKSLYNKLFVKPEISLTFRVTQIRDFGTDPSSGLRADRWTYGSFHPIEDRRRTQATYPHPARSLNHRFSDWERRNLTYNSR